MALARDGRGLDCKAIQRSSLRNSGGSNRTTTGAPFRLRAGLCLFRLDTDCFAISRCQFKAVKKAPPVPTGRGFSGFQLGSGRLGRSR
jgi:hypothetical protein